MNKVVITSKTRMSHGYCIGGYDVSDGKYIRLLKSNGSNQGYDTQFEVGELWRLAYEQKQDVTPPHIEDVSVKKQIYIRRIEDLSDYILRRITPYNGSITGLFNNTLGFTSNGGPYINGTKGLPTNSVGFWLLPDDLEIVRADNGRIRYKVKGTIYEMPYVGLQPAIDLVPAGTLVRMSLARWWSPEPNFEQRCYAQLSGWY